MSTYSYKKSLKTGGKASFFNLNTALTFPAASIVRFLYDTRVTPHQVIGGSLVAGIISGYLFSRPEYISNAAGVLFLLIKNILDKADGQLARSRGSGSRYGRFLDSLSDFAVNVAVYTGLTIHLYRLQPQTEILLLGFWSLVFGMLQCSFFVYYQVSFINRINPSGLNRTDESVLPEDIERYSDSREGKKLLRMQKSYLAVYGWQDLLIGTIDKLLYSRFCKRFPDADCDTIWYRNPGFLSAASILGLGTQIGIISLAVLFMNINLFFRYTCFIANVYMILLFIYRYLSAFIMAHHNEE